YSEDDTRVRLTLARNDLGMDDVGEGYNEDEVAVVIDPPVTPVTPVVPVTPVTPVTPVDPVNPLDPATPVAPLDPGPPVLPDVDIPVDDPVVIVVDSDDGEDEVVEVAVEEPRPIDETETILHDAVVVMTAPDAREAFRQLS